MSVVDRDEALEMAKAAGRPSMITGLGQSGNYFYKESPTEDGSGAAVEEGADPAVNEGVDQSPADFPEEQQE